MLRQLALVTLVTQRVLDRVVSLLAFLGVLQDIRDVLQGVSDLLDVLIPVRLIMLVVIMDDDRFTHGVIPSVSTRDGLDDRSTCPRSPWHATSSH